MELTIYGPLRAATGAKTVELDAGGTVEDVLDAFLAEYPRADRHLLDEDGNLQPSVRVVQDGDSLSLDDHCSPESSLAVFPAFRGG